MDPAASPKKSVFYLFELGREHYLYKRGDQVAVQPVPLLVSLIRTSLARIFPELSGTHRDCFAGCRENVVHIRQVMDGQVAGHRKNRCLEDLRCERGTGMHAYYATVCFTDYDL